MIAVVCVSSVYYLFSLSPVPLTRSYWGHRDCCVCNVTLFIKSVSDHYSVDFHGNRRGFNLNHPLGCLPYCI